MTRLVVPDAIHHTDPGETLEYITGWNDCRAAMLAKQPAQQGPVGEVNRYGLDSHGRKWHCIHWYDPNVDVPHGTKLYTTPQTQSAQPEHHDPIGVAQDKLIAAQAAQAQPARLPLTDRFLEALAEKHVTNCYFDTLAFARAIEAAHGIKENT